MSDDRLTPIPAPKGLGLAGKRLWKAVTGAYTLRPDELMHLESAARTADTVALLDDALVGQDLIVAGSMGQLREHPLLSEVRQQRALLSRLMAAMRLPDAEGLATTSTRARKAAQARWTRRPGA